MKSTNLFLAAAALCAALFSGCSSTPTEETQGVVNVVEAMKNPQPLKASLLGSKIRFIPLETTDSSLIGAHWSLVEAGDHIIINNNSYGVSTDVKDILVFDGKSGKFLTGIGHKGQGPNDYTYPTYAMSADRSKIYFTAASGSGWVGYDMSDKFIGKILPELSNTITGIIKVGGLYSVDDSIAYLYDRRDVSSRELIFKRFTLDGRLLDSTVVFQGQKLNEIDLSNVQSLAIHTNKVGFEKGKQSVIGLSINGGDVKILPGLHNQLVNGEIHVSEELSDTIFSLAKDGLYPSLVFDLGEKRFPSSQKNLRLPNSDELLMAQVYETPSKVLFSLSQGWPGDDAHKEFIGIYNVKSGQTVIGSADDGIADDLSDFLPFNPIMNTSSGEFAGVVTMDEIYKWLDEHPDAKMPEWAEGLDAESNPIIVIISD